MFKRRKNRKAASIASELIAQKIKDPYIYYKDGPLCFRFEKENKLSENQVMVFEEELKKAIFNEISNHFGTVFISTEDPLMSEVAVKANIHEFPEKFFPTETIMTIDDKKIFVYEKGVKGGTLIKRK